SCAGLWDSSLLEGTMSRGQFLAADRRVRCAIMLVLLLTSCVAIGLGFAVPAWTGLRDLIRDQEVGLLLAGLLLATMLLIPFLSIRWVDRRFGVQCPRCRRSATLAARTTAILRSGRCCWCQRRIFEHDTGATPSQSA